MNLRPRVRLNIFDQIIHLRCTSPDELYALAREVERYMVGFAEQDDRISVTQLALLAALSLAKETVAAKEEASRLQLCVSKLEHTLAHLKSSSNAQSNY